MPLPKTRKQQAKASKGGRSANKATTPELMEHVDELRPKLAELLVGIKERETNMARLAEYVPQSQVWAVAEVLGLFYPTCGVVEHSVHNHASNHYKIRTNSSVP